MIRVNDRRLPTSGSGAANGGYAGETIRQLCAPISAIDGCIDRNQKRPFVSGGLVLDRDGFCVDISTPWLEGECGGEKARFSAAIPARLLAG